MALQHAPLVAPGHNVGSLNPQGSKFKHVLLPNCLSGIRFDLRSSTNPVESFPESFVEFFMENPSWRIPQSADPNAFPLRWKRPPLLTHSLLLHPVASLVAANSALRSNAHVAAQAVNVIAAAAPTTTNMSIPNEIIGCIIGKGGSKINEIRLVSRFIGFWILSFWIHRLDSSLDSTVWVQRLEFTVWKPHHLESLALNPLGFSTFWKPSKRRNVDARKGLNTKIANSNSFSPSRQLSGAQIKITNAENGLKYRTISITGTSESINLAQYLIHSRYLQSEQTVYNNDSLLSPFVCNNPNRRWSDLSHLFLLRLFFKLALFSLTLSRTECHFESTWNRSKSLWVRIGSK